jgi:multisubunit Na+/H+ antiporter MnhB subunit/predicted ATPase
MKLTPPDRHAAKDGAAWLGWLPVVAGVMGVVAIAVLEVWATPPSWLLGAHQRTVLVLGWAKDNLLSAPAVAAAAAVAAVAVPFVLRWRDGRQTRQLAVRAQDAQYRAVMLRRVRYKWITGVLEPSLARAAQLALGLERRSDVLHLGTRSVLRPGRPPQPLAVGIPISQVFDQVGGGLLILGAPGAGKTTLLLQLAEELLDRADHDPQQPIPVVLNLASWARTRKPLASWLVDELKISYAVSGRLAQAWVEQDALALLLDGLDEVAAAARADCAEKINAYRREHGLVPLAVCSRTQELQDLATVLQLEEAVELQPASDTQVDTYLGHLEATGTPLADVRAAMQTDQALAELLHSPLMLHVVALAYHGRPVSGLQDPGSAGERQEWLWAAYMARMFEQRPLGPNCRYGAQQAVDWLRWLARTLRDREQTEFHLDRLAPDWLPTAARRASARLMTSLVSGLAAGLAFGLAFGLAYGPIYGLVTGVAFAGALMWLTRSEEFEPAEWISWSRPPLFILATVLPAGLLVGVFIGIRAGVAIGLASASAMGFAWLALWGMSWGSREERTAPNEGMRRSARSALISGAVVGFPFGLYYWFTLVVNRRTGGLISGLAITLAFVIGYGLTAALKRGGGTWLQHYIVRALLVLAHLAPWDYPSFLDAMAARLLLRRSGSAYLFVHRLLRDYLADLGPERAPARDPHGSR